MPMDRASARAHRSTAPHRRTTHSRETALSDVCRRTEEHPHPNRYAQRCPHRCPRTQMDMHAQIDTRRDVLRICTNYRGSRLHCRRRGSPCTMKVVVRLTTLEVLTGTSPTGGDLHARDDVSSLVEVRVHGCVGHSRAHAVPTRSATVPHGVPCCAGYRAAWDTVPLTADECRTYIQAMRGARMARCMCCMLQ